MKRVPVICLVVLAGACTGGAPRPPIEVRDAWARPADSAATTAAYFVLVNHETAAATLASASSPFAESAGVHETMQMDGMMHMMAVEAPLVIAAGDSLVLKPGAKHLMVSGLRRRLAAGDSLPLVLTFADGRTLPAVAVVRAP
jgi:copper(I)-binding protein